MNVKSRQQENAEATREALLESALSAFIEHGYGGVSIDAIAREARVTKGAFYHHFGSKQELLAECYERQVRTIAEDLDRVPAQVDKWAEAAALAEAFIDSVMARGKRQLSLQEVITVVGWERWKRIDSRHTLRYVGRLVDELAARPWTTCPATAPPPKRCCWARRPASRRWGAPSTTAVATACTGSPANATSSSGTSTWRWTRSAPAGSAAWPASMPSSPRRTWN